MMKEPILKRICPLPEGEKTYSIAEHIPLKKLKDQQDRLLVTNDERTDPKGEYFPSIQYQMNSK